MAGERTGDGHTGLQSVETPEWLDVGACWVVFFELYLVSFQF